MYWTRKYIIYRYRKQPYKKCFNIQEDIINRIMNDLWTYPIKEAILKVEFLFFFELSTKISMNFLLANLIWDSKTSDLQDSEVVCNEISI